MGSVKQNSSSCEDLTIPNKKDENSLQTFIGNATYPLLKPLNKHIYSINSNGDLFSKVMQTQQNTSETSSRTSTGLAILNIY